MDIDNTSTGNRKQSENKRCLLNSMRLQRTTEEKKSYYDIRIANARKNFEDNLKQLLKLQIATLNGDKALAKAAVPVIGAAGDILDQCKAKLDDAQKKFDTAARIAAKVGKTYSIMQHFVKATSQLKLTADSTGYFKETSFTQKSLGKVQPSKCEAPSGGEKAAALTTETVAREPDLPPFALKAKLSVKCSTNSGGSTCHSATVAANGWIQLDLAHTTGDVPDTTAAWRSNTHTTSADFGNEIALLDDNITNLNNALKELKEADPTAACAAKITDHNSIAGTGLFKRLAIKILLQKQDNEKEETSPAETLEKALTTAYGEGGKNFNKVVHETPGNRQTEISADGKKKTEPLTSVETFTDLADALARATLKRLAIETDPQASGEPTLKGVQGCSGKTG
uniref:Variant surface glycoprotein 1125.5053 n=1 Tax=Trypanosoma brucei TaxID=5691 RepID=A0A1J0RBY8_9TRYP|nr:variant surface glycoprotein 1125.5053 [Trypanosoma brucei]